MVAGHGGGLTALRGGPYLQQTAAGRSWRVGAGVFWQVHPAAADVLTRAVLDALQPRPGEVALDLYCGAGLFAGVLAEAVGPSGEVIGMESDPAAVRDARHNLRGTPWARVHRGDAAEVLARGGWAGAYLAVLDPPRAGAARPVLDALLSRRRPGRAVAQEMAGETAQATALYGNSAGSPTCPATRPPWPAIWRCSPRPDGSWRRCGRSTRSR